MSIQEIPLESEEIIQEKDEEITENNTEIIEKDEEIQEIQEIQKNEAVGDAKKPRGRPKGSTKPKPPPPPEKPEKPKTVAKAKPQKKKVVHYQSESSEEELPQYVRSQLPQRDLATQMFQLLQNHENQRAQRKKQIYNSWFSHF
jgi:hypothetical protein